MGCFQAMKIYFARHGESQANTQRILSTRGLKHPLTRTGRQQATLLAQRLQDQSITYIYSSPILRALETSILVAQVLGLDYEVTEALRENDVGVLEDRADEEAWHSWRVLFDEWTLHQRRETVIEGGETYHHVQNRFDLFVDSLIQKYAQTNANLLCVGHGALYWTALPHVLKNVDTEFIIRHNGFDYTTPVVAELTTGGLFCVEWNGITIGAPENRLSGRSSAG
jgi:broad specificity phosphatase PhoE